MAVKIAGKLRGKNPEEQRKLEKKRFRGRQLARERAKAKKMSKLKS